MSMNIKDEEVHRLARKLADQTGHSMTQVVREALLEYDAKMSEEARKAQFRQALENLVGSLKDEGITAANAADFLYDEDGLPH